MRFASARSAAIALGIPVSTYGAHERAEQPGGRDYGPEQARHYATRFGVTPEWLLTGHRAKGSADVPAQAQRPASDKVRVLGYVGAGGDSHLYAIESDDFEELNLPGLATASSVALEIRGESMGKYLNRWFVVYDNSRRQPAANLIGKLCVVALEDGRILLKRLARGETKGMFDLISVAAPTIRNVDVAWAAKVTAIIQR
jgi:hypothetical protein